jgi:hypothetical protein
MVLHAARGAAMLLAVTLLASALPVAANHLQTDSGKSISFDHKTGNAWWVEVVLGGSGASSVTRVDVMETFDRVWRPLEKKSWGAWAGSYGFGTDTEVRFRATFSDGVQTTSCWFDHPSGTERCPAPPPPGTWRATRAFVSGPPGNSWAGHMLAAGDLDRDGRDEIFVPTEDGLMVHKRMADGTWTGELVFPQPRDNDGRAMVTVGDVDGDGQPEAYSSGWGGAGRDLLYSHEWNGAGYVTNLILQQSLLVQDLEVGTIRDDLNAELYVTAADGFGAMATYAVDRPLGGTYRAFTISGQATGEFAIGNVRRNGNVVIWTEGNYDDPYGYIVIDHIGGFYSTYSEGLESPDGLPEILIVDGDGDGQVEIYALRVTDTGDTRIDRHAVRETSWATTSIPIPTTRGAFAMAFGDADLDGTKELYVGDWDGRITQVKWTGSAWSVQHVASIGSGMGVEGFLFADGDGDGKAGLYAYGTLDTGSCCAPIEVWNIAFTGSPPPPEFDATFTGVRGNEWWVQANVAASGGTLAKVDVRLNGGEWKPLAKQSWGGWAASYRIVQGTVVQLRATATSGATDLSDCYQWIPPSGQDAAKVSCTSPPPPGFDATFSGAKGNQWWVQVNVAANQPLAGVDARVNCGSWVALTLQSWGGWAKSFHVPDGSKVDFRARSTTGATDTSGGYIWPAATPTSGC